jgi:hypothetical protein
MVAARAGLGLRPGNHLIGRQSVILGKFDGEKSTAEPIEMTT